MKDTATYHRLNITLPSQTVRLVDRVTAKGDRSRFIADAIAFYISATRRAELKKRLKEGALSRAGRDRIVASEWFSLDEEIWRRGGRK